MKPKIFAWKDPTIGIDDGHTIQLLSKDGKVRCLLSARKANIVMENIKHVKKFANAYKT